MASLALPGRLAAAPTARPPNVLFIAIDDLNDWLGCLGTNPDARTPNLDRLAARGVLFTNAHCVGPACNPSRTGVMTGIRPSTSGVYHNTQPWRQSPVLAEWKTIPGHFKEHGYHAIASGKIFHQFGDAPSWDHYWPSAERVRPPEPAVPPRQARPLNGLPGTGTFDWGPIDVPREAMSDWQVASWAAEHLGRRHERPFFLACGIFRPHLPWYVPKEYFERFPAGALRLPPVLASDLDDLSATAERLARPGEDHATILAHDLWRPAVQGYLASSAFADDCLGQVLDALDGGPHRDDTVVVLWSDHGWHFGEKLHWRKFTLWEESTRVPLMISVPGVTAAGRCDAPVDLVDLYPTLVELCGLPAKAGLDGNSLLPLLRRPDAEWQHVALTTHGRGNHGVRSRHWRYIRYASGDEELYDHRHDPHEWFNLAGDRKHAAVKARLASYLPEVDAEDSPYRPRGG